MLLLPLLAVWYLSVSLREACKSSWLVAVLVGGWFGTLFAPHNVECIKNILFSCCQCRAVVVMLTVHRLFGRRVVAGGNPLKRQRAAARRQFKVYLGGIR